MDKFLDRKGVVNFATALFVMPFVLNYFFEVALKPTTYIAFATLVVYHFTADFFLFLWGWMKVLWRWRRVHMKESRWISFLEYGIALILVVILLIAILDAAKTTPLKFSSIQDNFVWDNVWLVLQVIIAVVVTAMLLYLLFGRKSVVYEVSAPAKITQKRNHLHNYAKRLTLVLGLIVFFGASALLLLVFGAVFGSVLMILWGTTIAAVLLIGLWFFGLLSMMFGILLSLIIGSGALLFWHFGHKPAPRATIISEATASAPPAQASLEEAGPAATPEATTSSVTEATLVHRILPGQGCMEISAELGVPMTLEDCKAATMAKRCAVTTRNGKVRAPNVRMGDYWAKFPGPDGKPLIDFTCKASKQ